MSSTLNTQTKEVLKGEIKNLQEKCLDNYNINQNIHAGELVTPNNIGEKAQNYLEGLRNAIHHSNTTIPTDENLIINQFVADMKEKTEQVQELTAFTRGTVLDMENEILRLSNLTRTAQEALSRPRIVQNEVHPNHLQKAKQNFHTLKTELYGLIQSLFPEYNDLIKQVLGGLMEAKLNDESNGYIQITKENHYVMQLLMDMNIVNKNPYDNMEVKLAF